MTTENKEVGLSLVEELEAKIEKQRKIIKFLYLIFEEMPSSKVNEVLAEMEAEAGIPMPIKETIEYIEKEVLEENENSN